MAKELPERIGKYVIKRLLGKGGMGRVYHAYDPIIGRDVALKVMLNDLAEDPHLKERFIREAQSAGRLRHPHIVTIYDLGEENGVPYIAMEYLEGTDLDKYIRQKLPLTLEQKLEIIRQAADALAYAHSNGIVHRDIKPANIRLLDNLSVKIMDFGIAKMGATHFTQTGIIMGTPHYMAPEQIRDQREKIDGRADIFALGVVLYELLCGRRPFDGEHYTTVFYKIVHEPPAPLDPEIISEIPELQEIVEKALAKDPDQRYQSAEEFAQDLSHVLSRIRGVTPTRQTRALTGEVEPPTVIQPPPTGVRASSGTMGTGVEALPTAVTTPPAAGTEAPSPATPSPAALTIQQIEKKPGTRWGLILGAGLGLALILGVSVMIFMSRPEPKTVQTSQKVEQPQLPVPEEIPPSQITPSTDNPSESSTPSETNPSSSNPSDNQIESPQPPSDTGPEPNPAPRPGYVAVDIHPWGEIQSIRNTATGQLINLPPNPVTPIKLSLPPGEYEMTITHPSASSPLVRRFQVQEDQVVNVYGRFPGLTWPFQQSRLRSRTRNITGGPG